LSNYTQSTNFATKDALTSGDPLKIVKGTEINTEFVNISVAIATKADLASPTFTGSPVLPTGTTGVTQSAGNSSTLLATTAFVTTADALKANIASPTFTGTPAAPTASVDTNTTQIATTAFVVAQVADDAPSKTGTGASGNWGINITGSSASCTGNANTVTTITTTQVLNATAGASAGAVGTYAYLTTLATTDVITFGSTYAGSGLFPAITRNTADIDLIVSGTAVSGTWQAVCGDGSLSTSTHKTGMFLRIS
jgi:hypothetical protein